MATCLPPGVRGLSGGHGDLSSVDLMQTLPDVVPDVLEFVEALNQSEAERHRPPFTRRRM